MEASSLDALARSLARESATRRSLFGGLAAISFASLPIADASAKKKKRCKRKKRCGKGCCNGSSCFAKRVNGSDSTEVLEFGCCSANSLCKSELPGWEDQCCYSDEICDPQWPARDLFADSICCRQCAGSCLLRAQECVNGAPQPLTTARSPRYRR